MKSIVFLGTLGLVAALTMSSPAGLTAQEASIAGAWTINADASDDPPTGDGPKGIGYSTGPDSPWSAAWY